MYRFIIGGRAAHLGALVVLCLMTWGSIASAQNSVWIGGSGFWANPANWQSGLVPNASRDAFVNNGGTANVTFTGAAQANSLTLGSNAGETGTVQVFVANSLTTDFDIIVGNGGTGTLGITGGAHVNCASGILGGQPNSTGAAIVTGAGSRWDADSFSYVGLNGAGTLLIENGAAAFSYIGYVGYGADSIGTATVTGAGSEWRQFSLFVGSAGAGTLQVENGGTVHTNWGVRIGESVGGTGTVTVTGVNSVWNAGTGPSDDLYVGGLGAGTLTIADGARVNVTLYVGSGARRLNINSLGTVNIGAGGLAGILDAGEILNNGLIYFDHTDAVTISTPLSGNGRIQKFTGTGDTVFDNVSAYTGSFLVGGSRLILQDNANGSDYESSDGGTLRFENGTVNLNLASIRASASTGVVEYESATVRNGFLRGPGTHRIVAGASPTHFNAVTTFNSTKIVQDGPASLFNFINGGTLTNNSLLSLSGAVNASTGTMNINGATISADFGNNGVISVNSGGLLSNFVGNLTSGGGSRTTVNSGGTIDMLSGTTFELNGALLVNNGTINGTTNINYGSVAKGTGSYGVVNVNAGGVYAPGNSPGISKAMAVTFDNSPVTTGAPMLAIELGGTTLGTQYDQLHVTSNLSLGGTLAVSLLDSFVPSAGQAFDILDWGSLSGTFASINLPMLAAGLSWNTSQLYATGVLSVGSVGDYNGNGVIDAADYVVWRKGLVTPFTPNDYNVWRSNFGQTAGSGSGASANAAVPEPTTLVALIMAALGVRLRRRHIPSECRKLNSA